LWPFPEDALIDDLEASVQYRPMQVCDAKRGGRREQAKNPQHAKQQSKFAPQIGKTPCFTDQQAAGPKLDCSAARGRSRLVLLAGALLAAAGGLAWA
jgi:hypothetical protein